MLRPNGLSSLTPAMRLELDELKLKLDRELERCVSTCQYMIAVVTCDDERLHLEGLTHEFPVDRFPSAIELLSEKFDEERRLVEQQQSEK